MRNKKESREADKYGKISIGETLKLLIDIIGPKVVFDRKSKFYESKLREMDKRKIPYHNIAILQQYCEQFFRDLESNYKVPPLVMTNFKSILKLFLWDFSLYAKSNKILDKTKNEIALYLLQEQIFHYIRDNFSEKDVLVFLTDSYKKVFDEIMQIYKNNEDFYEEINKTKVDYKQNIHNWRNEIVYNPNWQTLVPVLDYLYRQKHIKFVHRLIGLYLRKNAQRAFAVILGISEEALKEIIEKTVNMIEGKKRPEVFPGEVFPSDLYYDNIWFYDQRYKIIKCLELQNNYENNNNAAESKNIIKYLEDNYLRSSEEIFLFYWLQTRAKIFEKYSDIKDHKETQKMILNGYKKAFYELLDDIEKSPFLTQFLTETILLNYSFNPRRVKAINDYYEYGCTLEIFGADKRERVLNRIKKYQNIDIRKALVDIHGKFCPIRKNL
jgi:hypothetical protein